MRLLKARATNKTMKTDLSEERYQTAYRKFYHRPLMALSRTLAQSHE